MKLKVVAIDLELTHRQRRVAVGALALAVALAASAALADVPETFVAGETLKAADLNANFEAFDWRLSALEAPSFFTWSLVDAATPNAETLPTEGEQTITFAQDGYYRVTLNTHAIHDTGTSSTVAWQFSGDATRLDSFDLELGSAYLWYIQPGDESRQVESTALFVSATAGQTLTLLPSLTVDSFAGVIHRAHFMYASEYLGPQ